MGAREYPPACDSPAEVLSPIIHKTTKAKNGYFIVYATIPHLDTSPIRVISCNGNAEPGVNATDKNIRQTKSPFAPPNLVPSSTQETARGTANTYHQEYLPITSPKTKAHLSSAPPFSSLYTSTRAYPPKGKRQGTDSPKIKKSTYNTGDSLVVTDPTTDPAVSGLSMGERTGPRVLQILWSYVIDLVFFAPYLSFVAQRAEAGSKERNCA
ncbi:hypothetical protein F4780DRAFT_290493 [Xylariomycetidae sp. FL0641]|nr:hypothetical protein F4780DRAFT_290493 [Xylariomycetidae sp. FL0641]